MSLVGHVEPSAPLEIEDKLEDGDLACVVVEAPSVTQGDVEVGRALLEARASLAPGSEESTSQPIVGIQGDGVSPRLQLEPITGGLPTMFGGAPRRTGRVGAGQHSYRYHLPRAVGSEVHQISAGSSLGPAWFRPWDQ